MNLEEEKESLQCIRRAIAIARFKQGGDFHLLARRKLNETNPALESANAKIAKAQAERKERAVYKKGY